MATSYHELLKRPEWQRKRLEVMDRADFKCSRCSSHDKTLNVHHRFYLKGRKPWEYPDDVFVCLCEACHIKWHEHLDPVRQALGYLSIEQLESIQTHLKSFSVDVPKSTINDSKTDENNPSIGWEIGRVVISEKYGPGVIEDVRSCDAVPKLHIRFINAGLRTFNLESCHRYLTLAMSEERRIELNNAKSNDEIKRLLRERQEKKRRNR
jgi:hypothetical protein